MMPYFTHIASHLEEIALTALPAALDTDFDSDASRSGKPGDEGQAEEYIQFEPSPSLHTRGPRSLEEDQKLLHPVERNGAENWIRLSTLMKS
jgi:hypothetical protein